MPDFVDWPARHAVWLQVAVLPQSQRVCGEGLLAVSPVPAQGLHWLLLSVEGVAVSAAAVSAAGASAPSSAALHLLQTAGCRCRSPVGEYVCIEHGNKSHEQDSKLALVQKLQKKNKPDLSMGGGGEARRLRHCPPSTTPLFIKIPNHFDEKNKMANYRGTR